VRKPSRVEEEYHALERLGRAPISGEAIAQIKRALAGSSSLLASKAADIVGEKGLQELAPDLISAFDRFMADGGRADKQCQAKTSIVNALNTFEYLGDSVFLAGARHVQMEHGYGEPQDAAVNLRCNCAYGLARISHPDAHYVLAELLVDKERAVRSAAARALTYLGSPESELMLRLRVLTGDSEPEVTSECFAGLMTMAPERSLEFVSRYLGSDDLTIVECAALAIGGSHMPQAFDALRTCWEDNLSPAVRRAILLPIALVRSDDAFDFLLEVVRESDTRTAAQAIPALSLYADERSLARTRETVKARGDADIVDRFEREFGRSVD
jgi:HEAT repeat protein